LASNSEENIYFLDKIEQAKVYGCSTKDSNPKFVSFRTFYCQNGGKRCQGELLTKGGMKNLVIFYRTMKDAKIIVLLEKVIFPLHPFLAFGQ
jgi:hypothetical protein